MPLLRPPSCVRFVCGTEVSEVYDPYCSPECQAIGEAADGPPLTRRDVTWSWLGPRSPREDRR